MLLDEFTCDETQNTVALRMSVHVNSVCVSLQRCCVHSVHAERRSLWFALRNGSVTLIVWSCVCADAAEPLQARRVV